jgi:hemerythrin-like domain-containing protein
MKATQILMEEHRLIERVLTALQKAASRLSEGEEIRLAFFINSALFSQRFADGFHHKKEEGALFPAMIPPGAAGQGGPMGVMLKEHEQGRAFIFELKDAAEKWDKGDTFARYAVIQNALGYVQLMRQHICKEDNILFPMAATIIPQDKQDQLAEEFERVEREETGEGFHEKYTALADVLEKESQGRT